jgi:SAM-dependent methyltransferase
LFGLLFNPFYIIRRGLYRQIYALKDQMGGRLLDFGCGSKPYKDLFQVDEYIGTDIEISGHDHSNEDIDVFYDGKTLPFPDGHFDSVFSSEVFEHLFNLPEILDELHRVLKKDGRMLITVPFVWDEHEIPYDYARYTSFGIKHLLEAHGFEIIEARKTTNYVATIFQMAAAYVAQHILPKNKVARILLNPLFVTPITITGMFWDFLLPKNENFFHNNVLLIKRKTKPN